jgi:hypothetical protein
MNYQSIRAAIEAPLLTAYGFQTPAVPVYFDNVINYDSDAVEEFVHVNIQFGVTTEPALTSNHAYVRGVVVIRVHTAKGKGAARNQELTNLAFTVLDSLNAAPKTNGGVYLRTGSIDGPSFSPAFGGSVPDQQSRRAFTPFFISRLETSFQATVLS